MGDEFNFFATSRPVQFDRDGKTCTGRMLLDGPSGQIVWRVDGDDPVIFGTAEFWALKDAFADAVARVDKGAPH